jgi:hypothetical protein
MFTDFMIVRCDQLKNKSSRRVTYGNPCYSIGSKANSIYFLKDRSVQDNMLTFSCCQELHYMYIVLSFQELHYMYIVLSFRLLRDEFSYVVL